MSIRDRSDKEGSDASLKQMSSGPEITSGPAFTDAQFGKLEGQVRLLVELLELRDWTTFAWLTGIVIQPATDEDKKAEDIAPVHLPLTVRIDRSGFMGMSASDFDAAFLPTLAPLLPFGFSLLSGWYEEFKANTELEHLALRLELDPYNPASTITGMDTTEAIGSAAGLPIVTGLGAGGQLLPTLDRSRGDIGLPLDASAAFGVAYNGVALTGKDIVIGVIDDGCPFAHQDFLTNTGTPGNPVYKARILSLWDQTRAPTAEELARGWAKGTPGYGRVLSAQAIEDAINAPVNPSRPHVNALGWIDEEAVYDYLGYPMGRQGRIASHGSRVMGIAAGNGRSLVGQHGVAPEADLVFVQLPETIVNLNPAVLADHVLLGIQYVFEYAQSLPKAAVVNVSYGGYAGPHDGSGRIEKSIDQFLALGKRAVVVSAGNGFEADCHAVATLHPTDPVSLDWIVKAFDPTYNMMEIWYDVNARLSVTLRPPHGAAPYGPYLLPSSEVLRRPSDARVIGFAGHFKQNNGDNRANFVLTPTSMELVDILVPPMGIPLPLLLAPAPAGVWTVEITNVGMTDVEVHAWIQRDDMGPGGARRQQSRFRPEHASSRNTIGDLATGFRTIAVGAHNASTQEMGGYSAAGPTRPTNVSAYGRDKIDVTAPGEELPHGRGVSATSSARAQPTRIGGTSAAAPHVAGLVALILQYAESVSRVLTADEIRDALRNGASAGPLRPNEHQRASRYPVIKQGDIFNDVVGRGKVDLEAALQILFP